MQHTSRSLGTLVIATRVVAAYPGPWRTRSIIMCLAASCALMMIGFGISTPVFAKRLGELGVGWEADEVPHCCCPFSTPFPQTHHAPFNAMGFPASSFT